jgi:hypothetical protein
VLKLTVVLEECSSSSLKTKPSKQPERHKQQAECRKLGSDICMVCSAAACLAYSFILKMESVCSFKMSLNFYQIIQRYIS